MSLLNNPSPVQIYTPKNIKFSELYKFGSAGKDLSGSILNQAKEALAKAGYEPEKITKIITKNEAVSSKEMKAIAGHLNRGGIYGFRRPATGLVQGYLNKERVKAQNIARIRKEHILEAGEENLRVSGPKALHSKISGAGSKLNF